MPPAQANLCYTFILISTLEHGVAGEVVEVEKHVGRHLIRNFEAIYASPENLQEVASKFVRIQYQFS